ncbi:ornithine cyclodeaminase family protein [Clostridium sp.]|uniref:ornithine cyclodeaminase family protein n=1 Tax=Clostridium sp. TaxID=1506 RepID=UPI0034418531
MDIVILREEDMKNIFTMSDAIQADKDALEIYSKNGADIPLRVNINVPESEGQSLYMPGYAADTNALGVKIVSVYPKNIEKGLTSVPATMVLVNNQTGEVCSLMDGTFLTRIRTGAVSGAATDILSRKDSKVFALFGTGGQAETQLEAVLNVRDIEVVKVYDISEERRNSFVKNMSEKFGEKFSVKIVAAKSSDDAIYDADIITVVTTSKKPVFNGKLVKKGAHVNGVGSYTPDMQEIDEDLVCTAKVYVDTRDGVFNESGDLIVPVNKGIYSFDKVVGELGEVILSKVQGRENEDEITFFKTVGSSVLDVVTARRIYEKALENKVGEIVKL